MKNKLDQRGTIHTGLVIVIAAAVLVIIGSVGSAFAFTDYNDLTDTIAQSDKLSGEEYHAEAVKVLQPTQDHWLVQFLGVKSAVISDRLDELEVRVEHQRTYQQALDQKDEKEWEEVIELLTRIPDDSFYTHEAERIIEESRRNILELQLEAERTAREIAEATAVAAEQARLVAEDRASEEAERTAREIAEATAVAAEQARLVAEDRASEEAELRAVEELGRLDAEAKALEEAHLRAIEEVAKKAAETRASEEALLRAGEEVARKKAEREAERQRLAKEQEEKARVLVLAETNPMIRGIVSAELKYYIEPLPSYAGSRVATAVEDVATSFSSWIFYGASVKRVYSVNDADLTVSWIRDYGSHTLGQSIFKAHIKVGLGSTNCVGEWRAFDSTTVKKVLWHELGHSMGYAHSSDPNNVMYFQTATKYEVDSEVSEVIAGGWYYTFPICGSGTYSYTFETEGPNTGFNIFVLPPGTDPKSISGGGGNIYVGCGESGMHRYSGSCTVSNGAFIYIFNTNYSSAIRLSGSILSLNNDPWPEMTWDQEAYQYDDDQLTNYWRLFH